MTREEAEELEPKLRVWVRKANGFIRRHTIEDLDRTGALNQVLEERGWKHDYANDVMRYPPL